ncbi:hypothetical protein [Chroococcidiopsis sp. CCMEE 29]|uniref:hypothetical protein n=1 Tax=Chroococcidiopsis sp. CCMEE 29 TaxID=155894 RepID=UPI0020217B67|nr:hypothetical protein [Chroococcidiopsis sp. CCMEE 29]
MKLGEALAKIRRKPKLYKTTHKNFDAYCQREFGYGRRHGDNLISFASVTDNLESMRTIHSQNQLDDTSSTISAPIFPTNLEQTRYLARLKTAEEQWQVWNKAIEAANGKVPSGRIIEEIVAQHKKSPLCWLKMIAK